MSGLGSDACSSPPKALMHAWCHKPMPAPKAERQFSSSTTNMPMLHKPPQNPLVQLQSALLEAWTRKHSPGYLGTPAHLFDFLWTSSPPCRRPPDSASVVYTWQLCFCGVLLGAVGVEEGWKQWEPIGSLQGSAETKERSCRQHTRAPILRPSTPLASALTFPRFPFSSGVFTVLLFSTLV